MEQHDLSALETTLGYHFFEKQHLIRALTHPAHANELLQQKKQCMDQEAYSTLGDAVLKTGLILFLMEKGFLTKGQITQEKEHLEDNVTLSDVGRRLGIKKFVMLGCGEKGLWKNGEEKILADTVEALIGAIFLDSDAGFGVIKQCIGAWYETELTKVQKRSAVLPSAGLRVSPLPASSRHGAPRGKKSGLRSRWRG